MALVHQSNEQKLVSAEAAAAMVRSGDCVTIGGVTGWGYPAQVLSALETRFLETGEPRDLTWLDLFPTGPIGVEPLSHAGMLRRVIGGWQVIHPRLCEMIINNEIEAYMFPLGTLGFLCRALGAGQRGLLTRVGLGTYLEPEAGGGRLNERTTEEIVTKTCVDGEDFLWYRGFNVDVAIVRGTTVDETGNLSQEDELARMNVLDQVLAAKQSGGRVIVQARELVSEGTIAPHMVAVPSVLVDAIVIDPHQHVDEGTPLFDRILPRHRVPRPPAAVLQSLEPDIWNRWLSEGVVDETDAAPEPLSADTLVSRRAIMELRPGEMWNVGAGTAPRGVISLAATERIDTECVLSIETGQLGGWMNQGHVRGNTTALLDIPTMFSFYSGGLISGTLLGMLEFDAEGNVNLLRHGDTLVGPGGSMDIVEGAEHIVFCGSFRASGLRVSSADGRLRIDRDGRLPRAVKSVESVVLNGPRMLAAGKDVRFLTERAVFKLTQDGIVLTELAPGVDLERDVLSQMEFLPVIADPLETMDARVFQKGLMGIRDEWDATPGGT